MRPNTQTGSAVVLTSLSILVSQHRIYKIILKYYTTKFLLNYLTLFVENRLRLKELNVII